MVLLRDRADDPTAGEGSDVAENERSRRIFRGVVHQGFYLAILYCSVGLVLELLHRSLPGDVYERAAGAVYGLPIRLLGALGVQSELIAAVAQGRVPGWLASAAVPTVGVVVILLAALVVGSAFRFTATVLSLRQR